MRNLLFAAWAVGLVAPVSAAADDPIVVRPQSASSGLAVQVPASPPQLQRPVVTYSDPKRPGYLIVRPQLTAGATTGAVLEPVRPQPNRQPTQPRAIADPKPADIPEPGAKPAPQPAEQPADGKLVLDNWDAVYLKGLRVGYFHVTVREYERDGQKLLYATKTQKITIARFGQVVEQFAEDATTELPDGTVLTTLMAQGIGRDQMLSLSGKVKDGKLTVTITGAAGGTQQIPWPAGVVGVAREATLFADRKPKPGDTIEYLSYEGRLNRVVRFTAAVFPASEIVLIQGQPPQKVLPVKLEMEPVGDFRLPPAKMYLDAETFEPLRMDTDVPMLGGRMTVLRTAKEVALRPVGKVPDLFDVQSIALDKPIPNVHDQLAVVYRLSTNGSVPADKLFPADDRQTPGPLDPATKTADLRVASGASGGVQPRREVPQPGDGALSSNFFIDWDTDAVKQRVKGITAGLPANASALDKARAVEGWVNRNMRATEFSQAMATCSNVANTLSGDCTEYAMLAAGLCRALGVPSRTAIGLVYAPGRDGKPYLAYHMWFEAWVGDRWQAFDATLGRGGVGPGHLKITAADWHDERSFAPLLPVLTVLGASPKVEVIKVESR